LPGAWDAEADGSLAKLGKPKLAELKRLFGFPGKRIGRSSRGRRERVGRVAETTHREVEDGREGWLDYAE